MFEVVLYYSKGGKAKKVAEFFKLPILNILNALNDKYLDRYSNIIIVCPTYGDEELPLEVEDCLLKLKIKNKNYAICELGNFFGNEKDFGAARILIHELSILGWKKIDSVSIDSVPDVDWRSLSLWIKKLLKN